MPNTDSDLADLKSFLEVRAQNGRIPMGEGKTISLEEAKRRLQEDQEFRAYVEQSRFKAVHWMSGLDLPRIVVRLCNEEQSIHDAEEKYAQANNGLRIPCPSVNKVPDFIWNNLPPSEEK